jgi:hypothetical protein
MLVTCKPASYIFFRIFLDKRSGKYLMRRAEDFAAPPCLNVDAFFSSLNRERQRVRAATLQQPQRRHDVPGSGTTGDGYEFVARLGHTN